MKQPRKMHRHAADHSRRTLHCLCIVGVALLSACSSKSLAPAVSDLGSTFAAPSSGATSKEKIARYTLMPELLHKTPSRQRTSMPFKLLAQGSERARIVNERGEVVRSAVPGGTIFKIESSPDGKWFLLNVGNAGYSVAAVGSLKHLATPPKRVSGPEDATVFDWLILDNDHLIGQADLPSLDTEGLTAAEVEGLPPRDTLIYLYTISSSTMTRVDIDSALARPFHIRGVNDGQVELLHYDTSEIFGAKIIPSPTR